MNDEKKLSLILCDDEDLFREGLRSLISKTCDYDIVGEADNGQELISLVTKLAQAGKTPDIVLLDVEMPILRGPDAALKVKEIAPNIKIVGLTGHAEVQNIINAFKNGFDGYVHKDTVFEEVKMALSRVINGDRYLSPSLTEGIIFDHLMKVPSEKDLYSELSDKEQAILKLFHAEKSPKEIAFALDISRKTVDIHKKNIMRRLGLKSFAGLIKFCEKNIPND